AGCHEHPLATRDGVASGQVSAPSHQAPSHIVFELTATDAAGATATVSRSVDPNAVALTFQTLPPGLSLTVGPEDATAAPFTQTWAANSQLQLSAPAQQTVGGTTYQFAGWSQGGTATQSIFVPSVNTTYTATYTSVGCSGPSYASAVLADAPRAYWRLGDTSGTTAADSSPNAYSGTYVGGVTLNAAGALTGIANPAATFDGANDHMIRNPFPGMPTTAMTVDLWIKTNDTTKEAGIASYASTASVDEFQLRDQRNLKVYIRGTSVTTGVVLNDGNWHHLAVTWTSAGGALAVYKDGALAFTGTLRAGYAMTTGGAWILGQEQDALGGGFETSQAYLGTLDEVAVYPSALPAARVQAHYNARSGSC
ncbi:MAG TPA: LamG-like jellyroll fold domain-containing protein, partial [Acidimicrobiia bacterium]|nr:LamG-like jellyroll fold domain-containing protein [Acidimicrobiia bacterium]